MYKILLVDIDNTILDFNKTEEYALEPILDMYNLNTPENKILYSKINLAHWKRLEKKEITRDECITLRWREFFANFGIEVDGALINQGYFKRLREGAFWMPEALEFLEEASKKYKIYAVTNGVADVQYNRIKKIGLDKYLEKVFISEEIGYTKPDKAFFEYVLKETEASKNDVIVLGDSLSSDIQGAINSGLDYVWFDYKNSNPTYEKRITHLLEFFEYDK